MIFSTNRTTSLGDTTIEVDVNENYFGAGALFFVQECAEDELALFEEAIKSDIAECSIGESADELKALNEGFVEKATTRIKELMKKFIEWIKSVSKSAINKFMEIITKDNTAVCKIAKKKIQKVKAEDVKYTGKALKKFIDVETIDGSIKDFEAMWNAIKSAEKLSDSDKSNYMSKFKELEEKGKVLDKFNEEYVENVTNAGLDTIKKHIEYLEKSSKVSLTKISAKCKIFEAKASMIAKDAERLSKKYKGDDPEERNKLAIMSSLAAEYKSVGQKIITKALSNLKQAVKISRSVVVRGLSIVATNEGVELEYSDELMDAMIETANYELDEAFEEMTEGKECESCEDCDDDIEDDDDK